MSAHVPLPDLTFRDGLPVSQAFDDVYFSKAGGIAETTHVFLEGNGLPKRFLGQKHFTIGELGFGTGLNFLVAWKSFLEHAPADHHLHFVSVEKFPLTVDMLREALAQHPELRALAKQLVDAYPLRLPGLHRMHFPRVTLTLGFGDAEELLPQLSTNIDAWFLDGFAPAKNADMWSETIFAEIGRSSASGATFATFTSAGAVRRGLAAQGFTVEKTKGYGHKREMSVGKLACAGSHLEPEGSAKRRGASPSTIIIGGGIAGCTLARALAERGCKVTLLERGAIAGGASGNPAAVLFPQLSKQWKASTAWYFAAYSFLLQQLARWKREGLYFTSEERGMLRLPRHAEEEAQLRTLNATLGLDTDIVHWLEPQETSRLAGVPLPTGAAYFPRGTWVSPVELCKALVDHPAVTIHTQCAVSHLSRQSSGWLVQTSDGTQYSAEKCCIATAGETAAFLQHKALRLALVSGQISQIAAAETAAKISAILCYKGYLIPQGDTYLIGATYDHHDLSGAVTRENHQKNIADVESFLPGWNTAPAIGGRTSNRATTPDRMPYVGAIEDGLYVSLGHGSRGFLSAPLAAESIASQICGETSPLTSELKKAVNPLRFMP